MLYDTFVSHAISSSSDSGDLNSVSRRVISVRGENRVAVGITAAFCTADGTAPKSLCVMFTRDTRH